MVSLFNYGLNDLKKCPYCGKDANFQLRQEKTNSRAFDIKIEVKSNRPKTKEFFATLTCDFCGRTIFTHYYLEYEQSTVPIPVGNYTNLFTYPSTSVAELSKEIIESFPEFVKIYEQSLIANAEKLDHLACFGLRKAIEFLMIDYLKAFESKTDEELSKIKNLNDYINLVENPNITTPAHLVRYFGNKGTHYYDEDNITFEELKNYVDLTCDFIELELKARKAEEKSLIVFKNKRN